MRSLGVAADAALDLAIVSRIEALGGIANFRLLRYAASRADFSTGEAAREIPGERQTGIDRRSERLVGSALIRVGSGSPKRYAATDEVRAAVEGIQTLVHGARVELLPARLICVRPNVAIEPAKIARVLAGARETFDADGAFALVGVFDDDPQLVRDLLHRLHIVGAVADEVRLVERLK